MELCWGLQRLQIACGIDTVLPGEGLSEPAKDVHPPAHADEQERRPVGCARDESEESCAGGEPRRDNNRHLISNHVRHNADELFFREWRIGDVEAIATSHDGVLIRGRLDDTMNEDTVIILPRDYLAASEASRRTFDEEFISGPDRRNHAGARSTNSGASRFTHQIGNEI
jgi:hypothetical protein